MSNSRRDFMGASLLSFLAVLSPFKRSQAAAPRALPLLNTEDWPALVKTPDVELAQPQSFFTSKLQGCRIAIRGRSGSLFASEVSISYPEGGLISSLFPCEIHLRSVMGCVPIVRCFLQTMGDIGHGRELVVYLGNQSQQGFTFKRPVLTESGLVAVAQTQITTATELIDAYGENGGKPIKINIEDRVSIVEEMTLLCIEAPEQTTEDENNFILHSSVVESQKRPRLDLELRTPAQQAEYDRQVIAGANANVDLSVWKDAGIDPQDPMTYPKRKDRFGRQDLLR